MSGNVDPADLVKLERTCKPNRRVLCSRTGRPHVVLRGAKPGIGKPWIHFAAAYPTDLNRLLARTLIDQVRMNGATLLLPVCFWILRTAGNTCLQGSGFGVAASLLYARGVVCPPVLFNMSVLYCL